MDSFWALVEECRRQARSRDERLAWLRDELTRRPAPEVLWFQVHLDQATGEAFTWDLWAAASRIFGGWCSDDGFCYFRLWMVGLGRVAFSQAVADPDTLAGAPEVRSLQGRPLDEWADEWPGWESLDYLAMEAHHTLTGVDDACGEGFYEAVDALRSHSTSRSGPRGERWDVRQEDEAARTLPRLAAMFPLPPAV